MGKSKTRQLHARVSEADYMRAANLAKALEIPQAELIRLLLQLPADDVQCEGAERFIVLDTLTANKLYRELNHWGCQRNQGVHALNRIAYYLRANGLDADDVMDGYSLVRRRFDAIEKTAAAIAPKVDAIAQARFLFR